MGPHRLTPPRDPTLMTWLCGGKVMPLCYSYSSSTGLVLALGRVECGRGAWAVESRSAIWRGAAESRAGAPACSGAGGRSSFRGVCGGGRCAIARSGESMGESGVR